MYPLNLLGSIADIKTVLTNLASAGVADTSQVQLGSCFAGKIALYVDNAPFGYVDETTLAITLLTPAAAAE